MAPSKAAPKGGDDTPIHDTAKPDDGKHYALIHDARPDKDGNPTVPNTPHLIPTLPGFYRPDRPTPIGGPGEVTLEQAVEASKTRGVGVTLIELKETDLEKAREGHQADVQAAREGTLAAHQDGESPDRVRDELAAAS